MLNKIYISFFVFLLVFTSLSVGVVGAGLLVEKITEFKISSDRIDILRENNIPLDIPLTECMRYSDTECRVEDMLMPWGDVVKINIYYVGKSATQINAEILIKAEDQIEDYADKLIDIKKQVVPTITKLNDEQIIRLK